MTETKLPQSSNPASVPAAQAKRPPRVSMSEVRQRLQVPDIPGYRMYWFKEENVPAALDAYYEFVKRSEITMNPIGIGRMSSDGNTDLGTNVSIIAGQGADGTPARLILMKLKLEYFEEDQRAIEQRNGKILQAIFGDEAMTFNKQGNVKELGPLEYRKKALFNRPKRVAPRPGQAARDLKARLARLEEKAGLDKG